MDAITAAAAAAPVPLLETLWPTILVVGFSFMVLPWLDRRRTWVRVALLSSCLALMWRYVLWRLLHTIPDFDWSLGPLVGWAFWLAEAGTDVGCSLGFLMLMRTKDRTPEADANQAWIASLPRQPLVDVFIATYNEEEAILERTIVGALAMEWRRKRVWILDDKRRPWLRELCARKGVYYLDRPDNSHAKAGNINHALAHLARLPQKPDFIAILDADFVPLPEFLTRTIALFKEEDVGLVQTPQHFFNPDPIQSNLLVSRVWPDEQRYFFDVLLPAKDAWGVAFCCGTSSIQRYSALAAIGGYPTDSVTEDYLITVKMQSLGFRTVYLNEKLSVGLAPEGIEEYITQRGRWCLGLVQICRGKLSPLVPGNGLRLRDRVSLIDAFLYWSASYSFRVLCLTVPILYWLFGINVVNADVASTLTRFGPYMAAQMAMMFWLTEGRLLPVMSDVNQLIATFEIMKAVIAGLIWPKDQEFKVTAKGGDRSKVIVQWGMLRRFLVIGGLTVVGILSRLFDDYGAAPSAAPLCLFWSWYNLLILGVASLVCVELPRYRKEERFSTSERIEVVAGNEVAAFRMLDVSISGARFAGSLGRPVGATVRVRFAAGDVEAEVVRSGPDGFALRFDSSERVRDRMIRTVFSGRYSAEIGRIRAGRVYVALFRRVFG